MSAAAPAPDTPVSSIAEAIARMEAIEAALPEPDGIACFNRMYLDVRQSFESGAELAADRHLSAVVNLIGN